MHAIPDRPNHSASEVKSDPVVLGDQDGLLVVAECCTANRARLAAAIGLCERFRAQALGAPGRAIKTLSGPHQPEKRRQPASRKQRQARNHAGNVNLSQRVAEYSDLMVHHWRVWISRKGEGSGCGRQKSPAPPPKTLEHCGGALHPPLCPQRLQALC